MKTMSPDTTAPTTDLAGLPADRAARLAARRAFVELKGLFLAALANRPRAAWLHDRVRQASDPMDLWLLRGPLLAMLSDDRLGDDDGLSALCEAIDDTFPTTVTRGHPLPRLPALATLWSQRHGAAARAGAC